MKTYFSLIDIIADQYFSTSNRHKRGEFDTKNNDGLNNLIQALLTFTYMYFHLHALHRINYSDAKKV